MPTREVEIFQILAEHLAITAKLLETVIPIAKAARANREMAQHLPAVPQSPGLQELLASTRELSRRVDAIVQTYRLR